MEWLRALSRERASEEGSSSLKKNETKMARSLVEERQFGSPRRGWCRRAYSFPALTPAERELLRSPSRQDTNNNSGNKNNNKKEKGKDAAAARVPMLRTTSLKTGKTPEKSVRFADLHGLDLADVRHFLDSALPKVPKSAFRDLAGEEPPSDAESSNSSASSPFPQRRDNRAFKSFVPAKPSYSTPPPTTLVPTFGQPGALPNFLELVQQRNVYLESAYVSDPFSVIKGLVRVRSDLGYHKCVSALFTTTDWMQQGRAEASYVDGSYDGMSDRFQFVLSPPHAMLVGNRLQFCVKLEVGGQTYWDNNVGENYSFQCVVKSPISSSHGSRAVSAARPIAANPNRGAPDSSLCYSPSSMALDPWHRYQA